MDLPLAVVLVVLLVLLVLYPLHATRRGRNMALYAPPATMLLLTGIILGGIFKGANVEEKFTFQPDLFFKVLLPPIIFESGYFLNKTHFFHNIGSILLLAFIGTLLAALVIGGLVHWTANWEGSYLITFQEAMVLGALNSATDPVSTISIFGRLNVHPSLFNVVFGESVLNDAVAIVLTKSFERLAIEPKKSGGAGVILVLLEFLWISFGSVLVGITLGLASALLHKHSRLRKFPDMELAVFICFAYLSYVLAEAFKLSGIMSLLFSGIIMGHYTFHNLSQGTKDSTRALFSMLKEIAEALVFLYLGMALFTFPSHDFRWSSFFTVLWCILARAVTVFPLCIVINFFRKRRIDWRQQVVMFLSGIRGAVAFALAVATPVHTNMYVSTTLVVILSTIFLFGGATYPTIQWLDLASHHPDNLPALASDQFSKHWFVKLDRTYLKPLFRVADPRRVGSVRAPSTGSFSNLGNIGELPATAEDFNPMAEEDNNEELEQKLEQQEEVRPLSPEAHAPGHLLAQTSASLPATPSEGKRVEMVGMAEVRNRAQVHVAPTQPSEEL